MEKQFKVRIIAFIGPEDEKAFRRDEKKGLIETFLHEIACDGKRFHIEEAGQFQAVLYGVCSESEIAQLPQELEEYFELGLWLEADEGKHWRIQIGEEVPLQRDVYEDGEMPILQSALSLTFEKEWALVQTDPPAERFLKLLLEEMRWSADMPQTGFDHFLCTNAHLRFLTRFTVGAHYLWNKGQSVLTTMSAQGHVAEFDISEKLYKRGVRVDE